MDSAQLSELLRSGQLRAVYHGRADRGVLKELTRSAELDLMRELRRRAKAAMIAEACKDRHVRAARREFLQVARDAGPSAPWPAA